MTFTPPAISFGWIIALIVLVADLLLKMMGLIDMPPALLIAGVCAVRL